MFCIPRLQQTSQQELLTLAYIKCNICIMNCALRHISGVLRDFPTCKSEKNEIKVWAGERVQALLLPNIHEEALGDSGGTVLHFKLDVNPDFPAVAGGLEGVQGHCLLSVWSPNACRASGNPTFSGTALLTFWGLAWIILVVFEMLTCLLLQICLNP